MILFPGAHMNKSILYKNGALAGKSEDKILEDNHYKTIHAKHMVHDMG